MNFGRLIVATLSLLFLAAITARAQWTPWVTVHYPYWEEPVMTPAQIDFTTATDLIYFAAIPEASGALDTSSLDEPVAVAAAAHAASRRALLCVGGGGIGPAFEMAIKPGRAQKLVKEITLWVKANGFEGVDVDFEPLPQAASANFRAFVQQLHTALKAYSRTAVLTGDFQPDAATAKAAFPARSYFDQVNVMTYDLSGAYEGWVTWYDSCIYTTGTLPSSGALLPSTDLAVREYLAAGYPSKQLGVGIDTWGYVWTNATAPQEAITTGTQPGDTQTSELSYRDIMAELYPGGTYHYDTAAKAPWLALTSSDEFVSYTDPTLCTDKMTYVQDLGTGRGKSAALTASATLQLSDTESATMSGVLTDGTDSENWYAHQAVYNARTNLCPAAGSYVCTLSSTSGGLAPQGTSHAVLTINGGGIAKLNGKLPDGSLLHASGHIDTSGVLILYASLYGKLGYLQGCPDWSSAPEISGQLAWGKFARGNNAGFATELQISGQ